MIGKKFGNLTVIEQDGYYIPPSGKYRIPKWKCVCNCGGTITVMESNLKRGNTKSCGCLAIKTRSLNGQKGSKNRFILSENYVVGYDNNDNIFIFDVDDFERISGIYWSVNLTTGYVFANIKGKYQLLSRFVMNVKSTDIIIDHRNHKLYDNRKSNLRVASKNENCRNSKLQNNNTSGVTGVSYRKDSNKWTAYIYINNVRKYLGCYKNKDDAIKARVEAEEKYFGEFSYRNSMGDIDGETTSIFSLCDNKQ